MRIDYCTSAAYTLSPACMFKLAIGYGVNKVYCERDELAVGKILMKAGNSNAYVFVSPEIHEIAESDGATKPILTMPAYGTLYKRASQPTKTHLNASGIVVRGGNGIYRKRKTWCVYFSTNPLPIMTMNTVLSPQQSWIAAQARRVDNLPEQSGGAVPGHCTLIHA